jgi:SSS family solute:Na+ symporter
MNIKMLIIVLLYEAVTILGVGWWLSKKEGHTQKDGDFALGGRSLPVGVVAATMALTVLGTAHILGVFEMVWGVGAAAVWFSIAHVLLLVVVCYSTGLWVRRMGVSTVPELLERLYGKGIRTLVSCVMGGVIFGILTIETQGLGIIINAMTGWGIANGAIVGGILGIFYVVIAGMKEVGWINLINAVVMYVGLILATVFLALRLPNGNFDSVAEHFTSQDMSHMLSIFGNSQILLTFSLGVVVAVLFSQSVNQMLLQTAMSAQDEKTIKKALWIAAPVNGLFGVFAVVIGLTAMTIPEFAELGPKQAATQMLVEYLPSWLGALLLASFLAAILSTFAMTALSPATIFSIDIYKALYRPDATEQQVTKVTRITIVLLAVTAIAVASFLPPILAAMTWLFAWLIPVFFIILYAMFWQRSNQAAVVTLIVVWLLNFVWSFTDLASQLGLLSNNAIMATLVSLFVGVLSNLFFTGRAAYFGAVAQPVKSM